MNQDLMNIFTRGRSPRGEKLYGEVSGKRYQRRSLIAGKCLRRIHAPLEHQGTVDTKLFNTWLKDWLLPEIGNNKVLIMDNATFHKSKVTREIIEKAGCQLVYLPPYSPDLNPIEKFWGWLKKEIRTNIKYWESLDIAISKAFLKWT